MGILAQAENKFALLCSAQALSGLLCPPASGGLLSLLSLQMQVIMFSRNILTHTQEIMCYQEPGHPFAQSS